MTKRKSTGSPMELLAPAGSFAAFEAAIGEGADAIYVGAPGLNARALSRDFTYPEIASMVKYAHNKGVRLYIAMNSLVKEDELPEAVEGLATLETIGPDALIIQDMGLFRLANRYFSDLPLHASTLMSIHNSPAVSQLVDLGFKRIVLPRELTIREIRSVFDRTGAELEIFVHGAMCFSYSGLCLFSSLHGGKSSLRGQCVQPCRRRYGWVKKNTGRGGSPPEKGGGHLFSMNDLSGIELLGQLHKAGVACLKIEGRMKSAEYVRKTVRAYRLLLDGFGKKGRPDQKLVTEAQVLLDEAMGRKRSTGFFQDHKPVQAVTPHLSGNIGTMVGRVKRLDERRIGAARFQSALNVQLRQDISVGDRLRLHDERSGERISFSLRTLKRGNRHVQHAGSGQNVTVVLEQALPGRKGKVFQGSLFRVDVNVRRQDEQGARKRLAGTGKGSVQPDPRRVSRVIEKVAGTSAREGKSVSLEKQASFRKICWWVQVASLTDVHVRLPVSPEKYVVSLSQDNIELLQRRGRKRRFDPASLVWSLPPVILDNEIKWYADTIANLVTEGFTGFQLAHFAQQKLFAPYVEAAVKVHLSGSYTMNILNSMTLNALQDLGFSALQFSIESDRENLFLALRKFRERNREMESRGRYCSVGVYVFGSPPLFSARLDHSQYKYGRRFASPRGEVYVLERKGPFTTARSTLPFSLLRWKRELAKMGADYLVVDLSAGNMRKNVAAFSAQYFQKGKVIPVLEGNFTGGLL